MSSELAAAFPQASAEDATPILPQAEATDDQEGPRIEHDWALVRLLLKPSSPLKAEFDPIFDVRLQKALIGVMEGVCHRVQLEHGHMQGLALLFVWDQTSNYCKVPKDRDRAVAKIVSVATQELTLRLRAEVPEWSELYFYFDGYLETYATRAEMTQVIREYRTETYFDLMHHYGKLHLGKEFMRENPRSWREAVLSTTRWLSEPAELRFGVHLRRRPQLMRRWRKEDLAQLPPTHVAHRDPDRMVVRKIAELAVLPPLHVVENAEDVLFEAADVVWRDTRDLQFADQEDGESASAQDSSASVSSEGTSEA